MKETTRHLFFLLYGFSAGGLISYLVTRETVSAVIFLVLFLVVAAINIVAVRKQS